MDHFFEWYKLSDYRKVRFAKFKLVGRARLFWSSTKQHYARRHEIPIVDWTKMKEVLSDKYLHHSYQGNGLEGMEAYYHCMDRKRKLKERKNQFIEVLEQIKNI